VQIRIQKQRSAALLLSRVFERRHIMRTISVINEYKSSGTSFRFDKTAAAGHRDYPRTDRYGGKKTTKKTNDDRPFSRGVTRVGSFSFRRPYRNRIGRWWYAGRCNRSRYVRIVYDRELYRNNRFPTN